MWLFGKKGRRPVTEIVASLRETATELQAEKVAIAEDLKVVESNRQAEIDSHEAMMAKLDTEKETLDKDGTMCDDVITGLTNLLGSAMPSVETTPETPASE